MSQELYVKIMKRVTYDENGCWNCDAAQWNVAGKTTGTARAMFCIAFHCDIPDGYRVARKCGNSRCVNPLHGEVITTRQNAQRANAVRRVPMGTDFSFAKLNEDAVRDIRSSAFTTSELARLYSVSNETARRARIGWTWKHIT